MTEQSSLQAVMHQCLRTYRQSHRLSPRQWQVCSHVLACRTPVMGGFELQCDHCDDHAWLYHACRDRHCPRCQRQASEDWCERQQAAVLPVTYYHLVFTLPHQLNAWIRLHPRCLQGLLFECAWATLSAFGADPKRLNGKMGMTAVLHTWGQTLTRHVHLHCLVPGGAVAASGQWHQAKSTYLFPVRALSRRFRGRFVSRLHHCIEAGELKRLTDPEQINATLDQLMQGDWNVYAKPCLSRTDTVVRYLARYSHRIALSDARILSFERDQVRLAYRDYRNGAQRSVLHLSGEELIRRFLLHVQPKGFMRIRHYGFLANCCRSQRLEQIRKAIKAPPAPAQEPLEPPGPFEGYSCPKCRQGCLHVIAQLQPLRDEGR